MRCFVKPPEFTIVKREKFLEDAKADPARFYRMPNDILRDRRLASSDRREILSAWQRKLGEDSDDCELHGAIQRALEELGGEAQERA
jgi:hypothetical protein